MIRCIHFEHIVIHEVKESRQPIGFGLLVGRQSMVGVFDEAFIFHHRGHILIAGDDPQRVVGGTVQRKTIDGGFSTELGIKRERIGFELWTSHVHGLEGAVHDHADTLVLDGCKNDAARLGMFFQPVKQIQFNHKDIKDTERKPDNQGITGNYYGDHYETC